MKLRRKCSISLLLFILTMPSLFAFTHQQLAMKVMLNNPSLSNSRKDIELAILDVKDAKATHQPTIEFQSTGTYMINPPIGKIVVNPEDYISGQSGTSGTLSSLSALGLDGPITVYKGMEDTYYNFAIQLTQPLYTWGKINTAVDLYNKVVTIKSIQNSSLYKKLESELEARESAIYYIKLMNQNLEEQILLANELIEIVEDAKENQLVLEQDVLEAKIQAKQIEIGKKKLQKEENTQLSKIAELINDNSINSKSIEYEVNEIEIINIMQTDLDTLIEKTTSINNDNIKILSILKEVDEDQTSIAKDSIYWKPDLALQIDASYSGYRLPLVETGYYTQDSAGLNITIALKSTIWDGGKKLNDIARKKINESKEDLDLIEAKNQIIQTLKDNLYTMELASSKIEYQELNSQIIESKINNLTKEYEEGYTDKTEVLKAKLELKSSELETLQQKAERATSYYTISYLLN
ncbi:MAG: TolC family protein [Sphaerochaetaceae bacterium]|nr:TolC family protein [Sphaerochaetaceae bacterium]